MVLDPAAGIVAVLHRTLAIGSEWCAGRRFLQISVGSD